MAKIKKKGTSGQAKNYITRTQAVRKLQISLPDFRRLCIFKGIYPREPRNKKKASKTSTPNTTFYYTKDIQFLLHEPLLRKFRDQKALAKKIARSLGRGEVSDASRLEKNHAPKLTLDHIIKERYPTFIDALRDLDDALSLLFLFANLPSSPHVPAKTIALCQRVTHEFQHYLITTNSLRKSFLSIKGIYYQATIQGQDIMWLVPYRFVQRVNGDVDYRIMATFVDFYTTLLGFVNYRLYSTLGLRYPPKFDKRSDENGAELAAFTLEGRTVGEPPKALEANKQASKPSNQEVSKEVQAKVDKVIKTAGLDQTKDEQVTETTEEASEAIDKFEPTAPEADTLPQPDLSGDEAGSLFAPFVFYVSREAPKAPLEFILRSFGCTRIGWDAVLGDGAFTHDETDTRITHQIVDRPSLPESSLPAIPAASTDGAAQKVRPGTRIPGRTYVQPQWVWDCINEGKLLRADLYAPGATLPPHLSPWVKPSKGGYDPRASLAEQEEEGEAELDEDSDEEMEEATDEKKAETKEEESEAESEEESDINGGMDVAETDEDESESEEEDEDFGGFEDNEAASESEDEEEAARTQHQKELEAEAAGLPFSSGGGAGEAAKKKSAQAKKIASKKRKEEEELERQKMMMSRKKRKLLEKMMYSNKQKSEEAAKLRSKRRKLEKEGQK
ncbi:mRNA-binding ribosome synthesis protein NOP7 [Aspergillus luchuensis]|uniref:Pescadillo homolog n=3 Tax=Aspergillus subgen. Circumdati TaxID=2720871 RepID=A0A146FJQ1_ASPKA|nr:mRNA-binding ribosome synthesis protein nop7 [Aspergillus luchuensis]BCS00951.1 mRNA-binding ribosome synthesis protein nop7 [Aspergillus luchuensis]BCS12709.1 mRNA-binding ribosome synthesis protein nop7 [Aspergillus luchuensis]GAA82738.1 pescadillo homolog [Aspergillus luchuensis IFO 4308]GAT25689.1 pescadillo homolog [Aspergillus luchuensis]